MSGIKLLIRWVLQVNYTNIQESATLLLSNISNLSVSINTLTFFCKIQFELVPVFCTSCILFINV